MQERNIVNDMEFRTNIDRLVAKRRNRRGPALFSTALALFLLGGSLQAVAKVYRWVDENGEVHYSETLPPDLKEQSHDRLNERGILVEENMSLAPDPSELVVEEEEELPRDASGMERAKPLYSEAELQRRLDRLLLLRYDSEQEILDAMEVETNQLAYDERLLVKTRESIIQSYRDQIREAGNQQRAGIEVDPELDNTIVHLRERLRNNENSMQGLKIREREIEDEFGKQLERYRFLVEQDAEEES
jgi:hypothetical protein